MVLFRLPPQDVVAKMPMDEFAVTLHTVSEQLASEKVLGRSRSVRILLQGFQVPDHLSVWMCASGG